MSRPLTPAEDCCAACRFYMSDERVCRRMPPAVFYTGKDANGDDTWRSAFPPVTQIGWCGEFRRDPVRCVLRQG